MLKEILSNKLFALCALVILLCGALASVPLSQPQAQGDWKPLPLEVWATILSALFTGIIALYAIFQRRDSRYSSERQLRAYVYVNRVQIKNLRAGEIPVITVELKNFGQTPAFNFRQSNRAGLASFPAQKFPESSFSPHQSRQTIGPGGIVAMYAKLNRPLKTEDVTMIYMEQLAIYFVGLLSYDDCFGNATTERFIGMTVGRDMFESATMGTYIPFLRF